MINKDKLADKVVVMTEGHSCVRKENIILDGEPVELNMSMEVREII